MSRSRTRQVKVVLSLTTALTLAASVEVATPAQANVCSSGAHTLSKFGDRVYPEMGNGGYRSVHTTSSTTPRRTYSCPATTSTSPIRRRSV
jgi:hypothetical protein